MVVKISGSCFGYRIWFNKFTVCEHLYSQYSRNDNHILLCEGILRVFPLLWWSRMLGQFEQQFWRRCWCHCLVVYVIRGLGNHSLQRERERDYSSSSLVLVWDFKRISQTHKNFNDYPYMCRPHDEPVMVLWQLNYTNLQEDSPPKSAIFTIVIIQDTKYDYFDTINQHFREEIDNNA